MSEQGSSSPRSGRILSVLGLSFFLIVLPLGSYIYLKKGYEYQKEAMKDLRKTQRLTDIAGLRLVSGAAPRLEVGASFHLLGLVPETADERAYAALLKRLHDQFDKPENIQLWTISERADGTIATRYLETYAVPADTAQLTYLTAAEAGGFEAFVDRLALSPAELGALNGGLIVLMDDSLYVRQAYPIGDEEALRQLVERTAILLPERNKPEPVLRREPEL